MVSEKISIFVLNWKTYNPKETEKTPNWFRVNKNILHSKSLFGLKPAQKWLWIGILAEVSHKTGSAEINVPWFTDTMGCSKNDLIYVIDFLSKNGTIKIDSELTPLIAEPTPSIAEPTRPTDGRTDVTDEHGRRTDFLSFFEEAWDAYPRKVHKTEAREKFADLLGSAKEAGDFIQACKNYARDCLRLRTEEKHIRHMSTFIGTKEKRGWKDWIDFKEPSPKNTHPVLDPREDLCRPHPPTNPKVLEILAAARKNM